MQQLPISAICLALAVTPALAEIPDYLDDRSSPGAVIRSLYNAINRAEYARALSYFAGQPAETVDDLAQHFRDTERLDLVIGAHREEDTPQGVIFELPVAMEAEDSAGQVSVFSGCYTVLRPAQGESFEPLGIVGGTITPAEGEAREALPRDCGGTELPPTDLVLEDARALFASGFGAECRGDPFATDENGSESHVIEFRRPYDDIGDAPREMRLFRFFCSRGAYNEAHVYLLADEYGEVAPVAFAEPELDIRYEDDSSMEEVRSIDLIGFTTTAQLVNSEYDPDLLAITSNSRWRGLGDASSSGKWIFRSGAFTLIRYDVDASFDGEINPETVIDFMTGP